MPKLFLVIGWMEAHRLKARLWLLVALAALPLFIVTNLDSYTFNDQTMADQMQSILAALPSAVSPLFSLLAGLTIILTMPLRGRVEWESGQFQTMAMGQHSHYRLETCRFGWYLCLLIGFVAAVLLPWSISMNVSHGINMSELAKLSGIVGFGLLSAIPPLLGLGIALSAIATAYYHRGRGRLLSLTTYLGSFCAILLYGRLISQGVGEQGILFQALPIPFLINDQMFDVALHFELPLFGITTAAFLVFIAGRILEEVEA